MPLSAQIANATSSIMGAVNAIAISDTAMSVARLTLVSSGDFANPSDMMK